MQDSIESLKNNLRQKGRVKHGTDYAVVFKYGHMHVLCDKIFKESIYQEVVFLGLASITTFHTY